MLANYAESMHRVHSHAWSHCLTMDAIWLIGTLEEPEDLFDITDIDTIVPAWK
ncbi:MAG: hypothetical protein ACJA0H_000324 [Francisellaceae bacterium]